MNKKIIPAEASFFVPVEKVLFDHSRMRRSLETAAAENYPALTEDILWDYTLFTFEKKQWALISIIDRSTYGEECIRHSSRNFVSYPSIAASLKDFTDGRVYLHDGIQISYNRERHIPECRFAGESDGIKEFVPDENQIQRAKLIFPKEQWTVTGGEKKDTRPLFACAAFGVLCLAALFTFIIKTATKKPAVSKPAAVHAEPEPQAVHHKQPDNFIACVADLYEQKSTLVSYKEDEAGRIVLEAETESPSELFELLEKDSIFHSVKAVNMRSSGKKFICTFELEGTSYGSESSYTESDQLKAAELLRSDMTYLAKAEMGISDFNIKLSGRETPAFFMQLAEEKQKNLRFTGMELTADAGNVFIRCSFIPADLDCVLYEDEDYQKISAVLPAPPVKIAKPVKTVQPPPEEKSNDEIGRILSEDGTVIIYKKTKEGKIVMERES